MNRGLMCSLEVGTVKLGCLNIILNVSAQIELAYWQMTDILASIHVYACPNSKYPTRMPRLTSHVNLLVSRYSSLGDSSRFESRRYLGCSELRSWLISLDTVQANGMLENVSWLLITNRS